MLSLVKSMVLGGSIDPFPYRLIELTLQGGVLPLISIGSLRGSPVHTKFVFEGSGIVRKSDMMHL